MMTPKFNNNVNLFLHLRVQFPQRFQQYNLPSPKQINVVFIVV